MGREAEARRAAWGLRTELMLRPTADGGVALLDPLFEQVSALTADQVAALDAGDAAAHAMLDEALLRAGPLVDHLRDQAWAARLRPRALPPAPAPRPPPDPAACARLAAAWPGGAWGQAERWRRLAEEGRAGAGLLRLDGLLPPDEAAALGDAAAHLPAARLDTARVAGHRADLPDDSPWRQLRERLLDADLVGLLSAAFGRPPPLGPAALHLNAWALGPGDHMAAHADGPTYALTLVIGLNPGWTAEDGGAITFFDPSRPEAAPALRWLPQAGDALVFAPEAHTWHAVAPARRLRRTLSGWWLRPAGGAA
jgi:hypothetical protein